MYYLILFLVLSNTIHVNAHRLYTVNTDIRNYNSFTVTDKNYSLDYVINSSNNEIDHLHIDHHINMYSTFTQTYFDNCDKNDLYCEYSLNDQYKTCKYFLENDGGHLYFHGTHKNELLNIEVGGDGTQYEKYISNHEYIIRGVYIIFDLSNEEKYENEIFFSEDTIKIYKYVSEPFNFYRQMYINILTNNSETSFCPIWVFN